MMGEMRCNNCNSGLLDRIGTELYCLECETVNNIIQYETQYVPLGYQSNTKQRRELDMERRLNAHLRQFLSKYDIHGQEQSMKMLRQTLIKIKRNSPNAKGTREAAAVVVYFSLKDEIKQSIYEFCKDNNIKQKKFNQKYIVYRKLFHSKNYTLPQSSSEDKQSIQIVKMEQKNDQSNLQAHKKSNDLEQSEYEDEEKSDVICPSDSKKAIETVFDDLFPNFYLRQKKDLIVNKLIDRISSISSPYLEGMAHKFLHKAVCLYYLIFAIIKTLKYKISFQKYRDIIKKKAGYELKKGAAFEIKKQYDELWKQGKEQSQSFELIEVNGIKIEDKNVEVVRIKFPIADSDDEFHYQYYFDDQFYN